jgi:LPS export ABC transporter permease LptG
MGILSRYIFREALGPTFLGLLFYTSIILMRQLFEMAGMIIKRSLPFAAIGKLLLFSLPHIVVLTVPMSLLFGVLIAVGRLSADSEIVAMRAAGISTRTIYRPIFFFSFLIFLLNLYLINVVMPAGNRQLAAYSAELSASAAETVVKPRVFHDQYENLMIYVNDVDPATGEWQGVFVADNRRAADSDPVTAQEMAENIEGRSEDEQSLPGSPGGQRIIAAERGNISVSPEKEIWMNLRAAETHGWDPRKPDRYELARNETQRIRLPGAVASYEGLPVSRSLREMNLRELVERERELRDSADEADQLTRNLAWVEIHKKIAFPFACIAFGVLGLPLGITNRRGGKSSSFSLSIAIILFYYILITNGEQLAQSGRVPPGIAMWTANIVLLLAGFFLLARANRDFGGVAKEAGFLQRLGNRIGEKFKRRKSTAVAEEASPSLLARLDVSFPSIIDRYVLREFLKILGLVVISVMALFIVVDFTETAVDVRKNDVDASTVLAYYRFHFFTIVHWTLPIAVLVSTLVTFGMLSRNNEVTALKANGISLYRLAVPIVAVAGIIALLAYFLLDFVLPHSTKRSDELKRRIEGKPPISATAQQRLWYRGEGRYIVNFLGYDRSRQRLTQVQVFEFHPTEFRLTRRVYAESSRWNGQSWEFDNGWMRSFSDDGGTTFTVFTEPIALNYGETPEDFATETRAPQQMTYAELRRYIDALRESGYSSDDLAVDLYTKTSWPAISVVMALIALPFAFRMGKRGALYGIGLALVLGIVYWMVFAIFTQFGEVGNLPPLLSAWAANILFAIAALYGFLHVET